MLQLLLVPVIMVCAMAGTIGLIKLIRHFVPSVDRDLLHRDR